MRISDWSSDVCSSDLNKWHTNGTFRARPSVASILRARILPPLGGDTMWADTVAAYAGLPQAVKDRIEDLEAEHDIVRSFGGRVSEEKIGRTSCRESVWPYV